MAREAAQLGAEILRRRYRSAFKVENKIGDKGVVTEIDRESEQAILQLLRARSEYAILSEEAGSSGGTAGPVWVVDPLDGTTNFSRGLPLFSVSVALMDAGTVLVGAIADPLNETLYSAELNSGAFLNGERLVPPDCVEGSPAVFVNHGYAAEDRLRCAEVIKRLITSFSIRDYGTTALELCYVASGRVDAFICSGDELWDYAAGLRLAEEAGCVVTDWHGRPWNNSSSYILVAKKQIHSQLVDIIVDLQS